MKSVYFARRADGTGPIKIGCSSYPVSRLKQLSTDLKQQTVSLATAEGDFEDEGRLHRQFAAHRETGEWFTASPEILALVDFVKETGELPEASPLDRNALVVERYRAGASLRKIGREFGISHEMVRLILLRQRVPLRAPVRIWRAA